MHQDRIIPENLLTLPRFRRFASLNARNLLYMQAELTHLDSKLSTMDKTLSDMSRGLARWQVPRSWEKMAGSEEGKEHMEVVSEIQQKLEKYSMPLHSHHDIYVGLTKDQDNALQAQASILALAKPRRRSWKTLNEFVEDNGPSLMSQDKDFLGEEFFPDLVALGGSPLDPMTSFLLKYFAPLFQTKVSKCHQHGTS